MEVTKVFSFGNNDLKIFQVYLIPITFTSLWADLADDKLQIDDIFFLFIIIIIIFFIYFFFVFLENILTFCANCLLTVCMIYLIIFSEKKKK